MNETFNEQFYEKHSRDSSDQPYMQNVLYFILIPAIILCAILTIAGLLLDIKNIELGTSIGLVFSALMLWFTHQKRLWVPCLLVPVIAYGVATYLCLANHGLHDFAMFLFPVTILLAGMFIGTQGALLYTGVIIATTSVIGYADMAGWVTSPLSQYTSVENIIVVDLMFLITGAILTDTIHNLNQGLESAQRSEVVSTQHTQELRTIKESLEQQVNQRTTAAEQAQKQAEKANLALERRMWQFAGIAHLGELMRGEQDVTTLAHNIMRGLCEYLDIPIGALFLLEEGRLNLAGSYAYPLDNPLAPVSFAMGEGIIGQAALEKRTIQISDLPSNYIEITSGLGRAAARHIFAVPFLDDTRVVGVLEMGSFTELFPDQVRLIESVLKDIAITFSTTQARVRIDVLLQETQQLAEELQAQEEELRAANEELEVQAERLRESYARLEKKTDEGAAW
ncbi:MAG: GAF domain-containing protein [Anaerolineae bacterium]|nr:GAF domain-containing protein [Anaerolineae bacterium]